MAFPFDENMRSGMPLRDLVTAEVMRTIAGIFNHLNIEEREGVEFPYIEKTARPSAQQPWTIVIPPAGTVALSDAVPLSDGYGSAGSSPLAARATHVHPLNVPQVPDSVVNPPDVDFFSQDMGYSPLYARADHGHSLSENVIDAIDEVLDSLVDDLDLVFDDIDERFTEHLGMWYGLSKDLEDYIDEVEGWLDTIYDWSWEFADYYAEWSQDLDNRIVEWSEDLDNRIVEWSEDLDNRIVEWSEDFAYNTNVTINNVIEWADRNFDALFNTLDILWYHWLGGFYG